MKYIVYEDRDLSWNILDMDRTSAVIISESNVYESEIDHQDCLLLFMKEFIEEQGWNLNNEKDHAKAIEYTDAMFREGNLHGFDVFSNCFESYFISHYPQSLENEQIFKIAQKYAKENNMKLGSFQDRNRLGNEVRLISNAKNIS